MEFLYAVDHAAASAHTDGLRAQRRRHLGDIGARRRKLHYADEIIPGLVPR